MYFAFPILVFLINIILYLNLNNLYILAVCAPLTIPTYKIISRAIKFVLDYKLYKNYEDQIFNELIELLDSMSIYVDKRNIVLNIYKRNNIISCDVYIKILDIENKTKKKDELKFKLTDAFKNINFNIIFDVKFNYKR
ncbi:hypothetical protein [Clostridium butyricum]|nr:hypothetical protein [Clostridium butyricum]